MRPSGERYSRNSPALSASSAGKLAKSNCNKMELPVVSLLSSSWISESASDFYNELIIIFEFD
jgi:hypothetical protein